MLNLDWISILLIISIALGSMACAIIAVNIQKFKLANSLLLIHIIGMSVLGFMNFLNHSGLIINLPILYRMPSFIFYLIAPCGYLYVKTISSDVEHLKKWDYLNFLPALLHFFELIPYHLLPLAEKQQIIMQAVDNPKLFYSLNEGLLPSYWHHFIRTSLAFIYGVSMVFLTIKLSHKRKKSPDYSKETTAWLSFFSWMFLLLSLVIFSGELINSIYPIPVFEFYTAGICFLYLGTSYYLFLHPNILYGAPRLFNGFKINKQIVIPPKVHKFVLKDSLPFFENSPESQINPNLTIKTESNNEVLNTERNYDFLKKYQLDLERFMLESKPFLKMGYSINEMSKDTGIPQHHLSALINKIFGVRFNDYINQYRIEYLTNTMDNPKYQQLSVEGIAQSAGFSSRISFFNALKKIKGVTPTEFLQLEKRSESV